MERTQHPTNNAVLGAPQGWDQKEVPCGALAITRTEMGGMPAVVSFWKPTADELAALNALPNVLTGRYDIYQDIMDPANFDASQIGQNPFFLPDASAVPAWEDYLNAIRKDHNSVGAAIEVLIQNCPPGLGAPVYAKLDTDLAAAMMSINAVKGVEIGEGMAAAALTGTRNADEIRMTDHGPEFLSNHAGGILGGISTGQDIVVRFSVKPTSSILTPRRTINQKGDEIELITKGRHDPCVGIRAVPIAEAMAACVILDHLMLDRAQTGGVRGEIG